MTWDCGADQRTFVVGTQSAKETIQLCKEAQEAGAEWVLVLTPSTWAPAMTPDAIVRFHREVGHLVLDVFFMLTNPLSQVAAASPIPSLIYNFPVVTAGIVRRISHTFVICSDTSLNPGFGL